MSEKQFILRSVCTVIAGGAGYGGNLLTVSNDRLQIQGIYPLELKIEQIVAIADTSSLLFHKSEVKLFFQKDGTEATVVFRLRRKKREQLVQQLAGCGIRRLEQPNR